MRKWMRYDRMEMSPALSVLVLIVGVCAIVYVYRHIIIETLLTMLLAIFLFAAVIGSLALTVSSVRWFRERRRRLAATQSVAALPDSDRAAMTGDADWLASGVELAFSPDGKQLIARPSPESPDAQP